MMEFTFNGVVRQGFGFYNPNHAAALLCALVPFLWAAWFVRRSVWARALTGLAGAAATVVLAATFSRTGVCVFGAELAVLALFGGGRRASVSRKAWLVAGSTAVLLLAATGVSGGWARWSADAAFWNRFSIWEAGLRLAAANPGGVGLGNSGLLASQFLLPDGVACRTLVNSHLTLWVEGGWLVGALWCAFVAYALLRMPWRGGEGCGVSIWRRATWVSFAGLAASGFASSVFDWPLLGDARAFGGLSAMNWALSWLLFVLFAGMGLVLVWGRVRRGPAAWSLAVALAMVAAVAAVPAGSEAPRVRGGLLVCGEGARALALYDASWPLARVLRLLPGSYALPLRPCEDVPEELLIASSDNEGIASVWLFGEAAEWACRFPAHQLVLVSPPPFFPVPGNAVRVYRRRFVESGGDSVTEFYDL